MFSTPLQARVEEPDSVGDSCFSSPSAVVFLRKTVCRCLVRNEDPLYLKLPLSELLKCASLSLPSHCPHIVHFSLAFCSFECDFGEICENKLICIGKLETDVSQRVSFEKVTVTVFLAWSWSQG